MDINKIGVIGSGTMGSGIAQVAVQAGLPVLMYDINEQSIEKGLAYIKRNLDRGVEKERITREEADQALAKLSVTTDLTEMADRDAIIEAAFERMDVKKDIFGQLKDTAKPEALFLSNTSGLSITEMAAASGRPELFAGMHFFNPVPVMELVEVIKGYYTSPETLETAMELARELGKEPVQVKEAPLFVVNRILMPMLNEAAFVLEEGVASREDIDKAMMLGTNMPIGPLALADMIGIDTLMMVMDTVYAETRDSKYRPAGIFNQLVRAGRLGKKTGKGFYDYE